MILRYRVIILREKKPLMKLTIVGTPIELMFDLVKKSGAKCFEADSSIT